jgi:nickel/cobalt transporter (NiCoT) family protein
MLNKRNAILLIGGLILVNIGAWLAVAIAFRDYPLLMGTSLLAYTLGLRHALDADHIAAIDNVTRKLIQTGRRSPTVGLFFSLGHSTVVVAASVGIAMTARALKEDFDDVREIGGPIGTFVSTFFLLAIAIMNLFVLRSVIHAFRRVRRGEPYTDTSLETVMANHGLLSRVFRPAFRLVTKSWHMYPLGLLFGLGFDTATESAAGHFGSKRFAWVADLVHPHVSPALHCRHDARRHAGQFNDVGCVRMGI